MLFYIQTNIFMDTIDDLGAKSCITDQNIWAALLMLVDGIESSSICHFLKIGNSFATKGRERFRNAILK